MPLYRWVGISIKGRDCKGVMFAFSQEDLDKQLLKQDVALYQCREKKSWFVRPVSYSTKIQFFKELALLLRSGILLPDALLILTNQITHPTLQGVVHNLYHYVCTGIVLSDAMHEYPDLFDAFVVQMVRVGYESGTLDTSLALIAQHLEIKDTFYKKMCRLALAPLSTFVFFCIITLLIFIFIIPQFASLFAVTGKELPFATQFMLTMSNAFQGPYVPLILLSITLFVLLIKRWFKSDTGRKGKEKLMHGVPGICSIIKCMHTAQFLQIIGLLLENGVQLSCALSIARSSVTSSAIEKQIKLIEQDIHAGSSLSQALFSSDYFDHDLALMISSAQESRHLGAVLCHAADMYQQKVAYRLGLLSTLAQPVLLVLLGLLVTLLIVAVYVPLFNLSQIVPSY